MDHPGDPATDCCANSRPIDLDGIVRANLHDVFAQDIRFDFELFQLADAEQRRTGRQVLFVGDGSFEDDAIDRTFHLASRFASERLPQTCFGFLFLLSDHGGGQALLADLFGHDARQQIGCRLHCLERFNRQYVRAIIDLTFDVGQFGPIEIVLRLGSGFSQLASASKKDLGVIESTLTSDLASFRGGDRGGHRLGKQFGLFTRTFFDRRIVIFHQRRIESSDGGARFGDLFLDVRGGDASNDLARGNRFAFDQPNRLDSSREGHGDEMILGQARLASLVDEFANRPARDLGGLHGKTGRHRKVYRGGSTHRDNEQGDE